MHVWLVPDTAVPCVRYTYVTPTSFLELFRLFNTTLVKQRKVWRAARRDGVRSTPQALLTRVS